MNTTTNERTNKLDRRITKKLLLSPETILSYQGNYVEQAIICDKTGIKIAMAIPAILSTNNEISVHYENPFSNIKNAKKIICLPATDLRELDNSFLAGIFLTVYKHYELIESHDSSILQNLLISSIDKEVLITTLVYSRSFEAIKKSLSVVRHLAIDFKTHENDITDFTVVIKDFLEGIEENLINNSVKVRQSIENGIIHVFGTSYEAALNTVTDKAAEARKRALNTQKAEANEFLTEFKENRALATKAFHILRSEFKKANLHKLEKYLKGVLVGTEVLIISNETREKVLTKLSEFMLTLPANYSLLVQRIIDVVLMTDKSIKSTDDLLETAISPLPLKRLSLKELIALKKEKALISEAGVQDRAFDEKATDNREQQHALLEEMNNEVDTLVVCENDSSDEGDSNEQE